MPNEFGDIEELIEQYETAVMRADLPLVDRLRRQVETEAARVGFANRYRFESVHVLAKALGLVPDHNPFRIPPITKQELLKLIEAASAVEVKAHFHNRLSTKVEISKTAARQAIVEGYASVSDTEPAFLAYLDDDRVLKVLS